MKQVIAKTNLGSFFDIGSAEPNKINPKLPEVTALPIATIPTLTGNTSNLNSFVTDPNGDKWFIDFAGDAIIVNKQIPVFATTVYVDTTNPTTASIFDIENPPTTHMPSLMGVNENIYIGTDGSTWTYKTSTSTYNTYVAPNATAWYLSGGSTDSGANKTSDIQRQGKVGLSATTNFAPTSRLHNDGTTALKEVVTTAATVTVAGTETTIFYLTALTAQTVTLPAASTAKGRLYWFINNAAIAKTISTYTSLVGVVTTVIPPYTSIAIQSDATIWRQFDGLNANIVSSPGTKVTGYFTQLALAIAGTNIAPNGILMDGIDFTTSSEGLTFVNHKIINKTGALINVTSASLGRGSENEQKQTVNLALANNTAYSVDGNAIAYASTANTSEFKAKIISNNNFVYEASWIAYIVGLNRHFFITVERLR